MKRLKRIKSDSISSLPNYKEKLGDALVLLIHSILVYSPNKNYVHIESRIEIEIK